MNLSKLVVELAVEAAGGMLMLMLTRFADGLGAGIALYRTNGALTYAG